MCVCGCLRQRVLQTYGLPLAPDPSFGVRLERPDFVLSVHYGKPADLFFFRPWRNSEGEKSSRGDWYCCKASIPEGPSPPLHPPNPLNPTPPPHPSEECSFVFPVPAPIGSESSAAVQAAIQLVLPSQFALTKLVEDSTGQAILKSLNTRATVQGSGQKAARPSRFALILAAFERDAARARLANLPESLAAFEAAVALVSGRLLGGEPTQRRDGVGTHPTAMCIDPRFAPAAAYDKRALWLLGMNISTPHADNTEMVGAFDGPLGQMAVCSPHALPSVWRQYIQRGSNRGREVNPPLPSPPALLPTARARASCAAIL